MKDVSFPPIIKKSMWSIGLKTISLMSILFFVPLISAQTEVDGEELHVELRQVHLKDHSSHLLIRKTPGSGGAELTQLPQGAFFSVQKNNYNVSNNNELERLSKNRELHTSMNNKMITELGVPSSSHWFPIKAGNNDYVWISNQDKYSKPVVKAPIVYHNLDYELTTVYKDMGQHYLQNECETEACGVAWPDKDTPMEVIDQKFIPWKNPHTEKDEWKSFYRVKLKNKTGQVVTGWIEAEDVSTEKQADKPIPLLCKNPYSDLIDVSKNLEYTAAQQVDTVYDSIRNHAGKCLLNEKEYVKDVMVTDKKTKKKKKVKHLAYSKNFDKSLIQKKQNVPDATVLKKWQSKTDLPEIIVDTQNGQRRLDRKDMLAIDMLARTLYGEMAKCHKYGKEYLMAVAATINNRRLAQYCPYNQVPKWEKPYMARNRFGRPKSKENTAIRTPTYDILSRPWSFSVWNQYKDKKKGKYKIESAAKHSLCPPINIKERFWAGANPPKREMKIWDDALKVAIDSYLNPHLFREKTKTINSYYYTSGVKMGKGFNRVKRTPVIHGKNLTRGSCMKLWHDDTLVSMKHREEEIEKKAPQCKEPQL